MPEPDASKGPALMHPNRSALLDLQRATQSLSGLSDREQIMALKLELFHALERANDHQTRCIALETRVDELVRTTRELSSENTKELRKLRLEILAAETQCDALDELCRSLLLTLESAVDRDADASGDSHPDGQARVSAS
jgi:hypothetical protein